LELKDLKETHTYGSKQVRKQMHSPNMKPGLHAGRVNKIIVLTSRILVIYQNFRKGNSSVELAINSSFLRRPRKSNTKAWRSDSDPPSLTSYLLPEKSTAVESDGRDRQWCFGQLDCED
jgi:hypothetical protein